VVRAGLALAVALPLVLASHWGILASAQIAASDLLFKTRASQPARSTVIIGIDQRSYRALLPEHGPLSQWPRTLYARALDALRTPAPGAAAESPAGPRVAAFGVFFDAARPDDGELAQAMRRAGNVVTPVVAQGARDLDPSPGVAQRFDVFVRPAPAIRAAAAGEGLANVTVARDSVVRGLPLLLRAGDERVPAMALTLAALYARRPAVLDGEPRPGVVNAAGRSIPVSDGDIMAINFLGPPSTAAGQGPVPIIPFVDVLEGASIGRWCATASR
jgi:CHASE2 domain-containing sensor protein